MKFFRLKWLLVFIFLLTLHSQSLCGTLIQEANSHKNTGNQYYLKGDYENAIKEYNLAIGFNPNLATELNLNIAKSYTMLGLEKYKISSYQTAKEYYNKAIKVYPSYSIAYINLGVLYETIKDYSGALEAYRNYIKHENTDLETIKKVNQKIIAFEKDEEYYNNGVKYMAEGDFSSAKTELAKVKYFRVEEAKKFLDQIDGIHNKTTPLADVPVPPNTDTPVPPVTTYIQEIKGEEYKREIQDLLILYENYFEKQEIDNLMNLFSLDYLSSMGSTTQIKNYFENFWFTLFEELNMNISNVTIRKTGYLVAVTCHISIKGLYIGKDMESYNKNFILGNVYEENGKFQFLLQKEDGRWKIIN